MARGPRQEGRHIAPHPRRRNQQGRLLHLAAVPTGATRLEHHFDRDAVQALKAAPTSNLTIGGADLAARAFGAGLVDQCELFVWPTILGGGKPALPAGIRADLELLDEHRFANGVLHLRYRVST